MWEAFGNFIDAVESVIRRLQEPKDMVLAIEPLIRCLVTQPDWLKEEYRRPIRSKAMRSIFFIDPPIVPFPLTVPPDQRSPSYLWWGYRFATAAYLRSEHGRNAGVHIGVRSRR